MSLGCNHQKLDEEGAPPVESSGIIVASITWTSIPIHLTYVCNTNMRTALLANEYTGVKN